jgi:hypothetical protein
VSTHSTSLIWRIFLVSLFLLPVAFAALVLAGLVDAERVAGRILFGPTVLLEALTLVFALVIRSHLEPSEPVRRTWTLVVIYLSFLLVVELRLASIYLGWVPGFVEKSETLNAFYNDGLRYLYILADLFFVAALVSSIRSFKSTGLPFAVIGRDFVYMVLLCVLPVAAYLLHENMAHDKFNFSGRALMIFRMASVGTGTVIACLCIVVRRYAIQMGSGALAGVWNAIVLAGIASAVSFIAFALLSVRWMNGAEFFEQYFLWIYAGCFLVAVMRQKDLLGYQGAAA